MRVLAGSAVVFTLPYVIEQISSEINYMFEGYFVCYSLRCNIDALDRQRKAWCAEEGTFYLLLY
jgi:hypothetical protein